MKQFWAKRLWNGVAPTVEEHCQDVCRAADAILDQVGPTLHSALGPTAPNAERLRHLVRVAALLHDLAKVNSAFQLMLATRSAESRQPVRHEILAAWLLTDSAYLGTTFAELLDEVDLWPVVWAIAGHHLQMTDPAGRKPLFDTGSGTKLVEIPLSTAADIKTLLFAVAALPPGAAHWSPCPDCRFETVDPEGLEQRILDFAEASFQAWDRLRGNSQIKQLTALIKAILIAADVAASALTAREEAPEAWIPRTLSVRVEAATLEQPIRNGTRGNELLPFQQEVGAANSRAIVIAGCGNGKTTAAYLWAQHHTTGRKLWFTYPTTGTASAGYRGYLHDHPDLKALLLHGRAEVDLREIRGNDKFDIDDQWLRLESLRAWGQQAIACTVDTVLGLVQNHRRSLFSFPAIAAGAFVFDEIHSYDARLFGALLRFLETFPSCPALLMSASIPPHRLAKLCEVLGIKETDVVRGDEKLEKLTRYKLNRRDSGVAARSDILGVLAKQGKVLWVCNTVREAVEVAREAERWSGLAKDQIIVFHSRFRYEDRVRRQDAVLAEFKYHPEEALRGQRCKPGPSLVVATQVCEMSLDISADLLVTAECPLPSLIQRLGRLNRYAQTDDPWPCVVYPFEGDPYNEQPEWVQLRGDFRETMAATRKAVSELEGKPVSQRELAARLEGVREVEEFVKFSEWLDGGWLTEPGQLRDGDNGLTVIREEEKDAIEHRLGPRIAKPSRWTNPELVPWTIPMLCRKGFVPVDHIGGYPVAAAGSITYCSKEGAAWAKSE